MIKELRRGEREMTTKTSQTVKSHRWKTSIGSEKKYEDEDEEIMSSHSQPTH
jgi:hypothetical protein